DTETLELLAAHGIRFTILSPFQAKEVLAPDADEWLDVTGGRVDPKRAYKAELPSGRELALFFYDGPISQAVAFEGLLSRGEDLVARLTGAFTDAEEPQLVHIATDGESYGHHHRYGDMALAYSLAQFEKSDQVRLTNYGEFLKNHPPEWVARIH